MQRAVTYTPVSLLANELVFKGGTGRDANIGSPHGVRSRRQGNLQISRLSTADMSPQPHATHGVRGVPAPELRDATDEEDILRSSHHAGHGAPYLRTLTSPKVVVAVSAKSTVTEPELPFPDPVPF